MQTSDEVAEPLAAARREECSSLNDFGFLVLFSWSVWNVCVCSGGKETSVCWLTFFMLPFKLISHLASDINQGRKYKKGQKRSGCVAASVELIFDFFMWAEFPVGHGPGKALTLRSLSCQYVFFMAITHISRACDLFSLIIVSVIQTLTAGWPLPCSLCAGCRDPAFLKVLPSLWVWVTSRRPQAKTLKMWAVTSVWVDLLGFLSHVWEWRFRTRV